MVDISNLKEEEEIPDPLTSVLEEKVKEVVLEHCYLKEKINKRNLKIKEIL
jgi:hypothetical protein